MTDVIPINPDSIDYDPKEVKPLDTGLWYETKPATYVFHNIHGNTDQIAWWITQGWEVVGEPAAGTDTVNTNGVAQDYPTTTYTLTRRQLKAELALQALVTEWTAAYNDGRKLNDSRYDDILVIYETLLDNAETAMNVRAADDNTYEGLVELLLGELYTDYSAHSTEINSIIDEGLEANREAEINLQFDNLVAAAKQKLVDRGMWNTATLTANTAQINKNREYALNDLADKVNRVSLDAQNTLYKQKAVVTELVMAARDRTQKMRASGQLDRQQMQVKITDIMSRFMERRTDEYPTMDAIMQMAVQFGASNSTEVST